MTTKIIPLFTSGQIADFWSHVEKNDGCWIWKGSKSPRGYGYFNLKKQGWRAHRISWVLHHGPIETGKIICHHCDNPSCVRPDHLFCGTDKDNLSDAARKGRMASGARNGMRKPEVLAKMLPQVMSNLKKMIEGNKGRTISPKLLAIFKRPKSAEHRAKISAGHKGKVLSVEHRKAISEARKRLHAEGKIPLAGMAARWANRSKHP